MSDQFESDQGSDGGGLRRQLEEALQKARDAEQAREAAVTEAREQGRKEAQRRFDALQVFGNDRPGLADAWLAQNPEGELTPDLGKDWAAKQFGITIGEQQPPPEPTQTPEPVAPEVRQAAQEFQQPVAARPGSDLFTPEEFRKALGDPARREEALRADREGRVQKKLPKTPDDRVFQPVKDPAGFFGGTPA
jgi:hypothetical protein